MNKDTLKKKKLFRIPKGNYRVNIPILLGDESLMSWGKQIDRASKNFLEEYKLSKKHHLGFEISDVVAMLYVTYK